MRFILLFFTLVFLVISCQPKDKFDWNVGLSAPKNYVAGGPFVEYFYQGKSIGGASSNVGINPGWGMTSGGYVGGDKYKEVPDSIFVSWRCGTDLLEYSQGMKLPRDKMLELFKTSFKNEKGEKEKYTQIVTGFAPGGNAKIWLIGGRSMKTEVFRFKAKAIKEYNPYTPESVTLWTSTGEEAKDIFKYLYLHGIPYKVWEEGEKEYNYDIGFASEGDLIQPNIITFFSKDGSWFQPSIYEKEHSIEIENWSNFI